MVMPHALTGVEAEIVVLIAKDFPIGSHKVEPAYSVVISTREFRFIRAFCLFARAKARRYLRRLASIDHYRTIKSSANSYVVCLLLVSAGMVTCSGSRKSELTLFSLEATPRQLSQWARGHWEIENCVFLGVRRDLPRRPQSCAKDRRASPCHSLYGDQRHSLPGLPICARWTQVSFCTLG